MAIDTTSPRIIYLRAKLKHGIWNGDTPPTEFYGPTNFTKLEVTPPKQKFERLLSNMDGSLGNLLSSVPSVSDPATLMCEFNTMTSDMLSMLIGSSNTYNTQITAAVTAEAITPTVNVWQQLANRFIAPDATGTPVVFHDATPVTPVVIANSHFEFDYPLGMFRAIDDIGATAVTVSYHKADRLIETYNAGLAVNKFVKLVGTATEMATNRVCILTLHKVNLTSSGKIDLVGNKYLQGALDGDMIQPHGEQSPWKYEYTDQVAG